MKKELKRQNFQILELWEHDIMNDLGLVAKKIDMVWRQRKGGYRKFEGSREFVRRLGLKNQREWNKYRKSGRMPLDIPTNPNVIYKEAGWKGYGDWLGTMTVAPQCTKFLEFGQARAISRSLGLKNIAEWRSYCKSKKRIAGV